MQTASNVHAYKVVKLDAVTPYERNARTHSDDQVAQLRASIRQFGFTNPLLIDEDNRLIAGHGRMRAALAEGMSEAPAIVVAGLSDAQRKALVIADNQLAANAGWDFGVLRLELESIAASGFDLALVGFTPAELATILDPGTVGLVDPDEAPEAPSVPVSKLGDVYALGKHRIICGDATSATAVAALLGDVKPHLMVTDPPYGVEYDAAWRGSAKTGNGKRASLGVHAKGKVENDDRCDWREAWGLFPGDAVYVWHAGVHAGTVAESLTAAGFAIRSQIIWAKNNFAIGRGDYHWKHEPCWYAVKGGKTGHWNGDRKQTTVWDIDKPQKSETGHSTQKPVECMKRPIENNSEVGDAVYEPFSGSGTTIIACEMTGRRCFAVELNPAYVDVAVQRWETFTGLKAVRL